MCRRELSKNTIPAAILINAMGLDEVPEELKQLNWIEYSLIQIIRPVKHTTVLKDIGGRRTGVVATSGALVLLPVPIDTTLKYVASTLPNAANMVLVVDTAAGEKLVSLPRVLRALKWLKMFK